MPVASFTRMRLLWGAFDFEHDDEAPAYSAATTSSGASGAADLRRCVLRFTRDPSGEDVMQTSIVFAHVVAGELQGTWTGANFATLEAALDTLQSAFRPQLPPAITLAEYRWYREGPGATPPEVAVRLTPRALAGSSASNPLPMQIRTAVSLRSAYRKRWGRFYWPTLSVSANDSTGHIGNAIVDGLALGVRNFFDTCAAADFFPVVWSPTMQRAYGVERIVVDNSWDTQRSGKQDPSYQKSYPV